jgi:hypothetical protein
LCFVLHCAQLTPYGLKALHERIPDGTLAVFFRNNHFCTGLSQAQRTRRRTARADVSPHAPRPASAAAYKHRGGFYLLVTDEGYRDQSSLVWESLSNVRPFVAVHTIHH